MATGVFYHPSFSRRSYLTVGNRLRDFPAILEPLQRSSSLRMYLSPRVDRDLLLAVHHQEMIEAVDRDPSCSTAWESAGGVVAAADEIWRGGVRNAFVFIGAGGHHAGRDNFGGACCFNDVAAAIRHLQGMRRGIKVAIVDTDAHHGDGTRELLETDPGVFHACVCSTNYRSPDELKIDIAFRDSGREKPDEAYLAAVRGMLEPSLASFGPDFIFWYFGFDTHLGDYGSVGLTDKAYFDLARLMVRYAAGLCGGRLEVVLAGGSRHDLASALIPGIISILTDEASP